MATNNKKRGLSIELHDNVRKRGNIGTETFGNPVNLGNY